MGFLDENGVLYFWQKAKALFVTKVDGKGLSSNDYTTEDKNKLAGIAAGADKTIIVDNLVSTSTTSALSAAQGKALKTAIDSITGDIGDLGGGDMMKATYDSNGNGIVDNAEKVNGHTVNADVPSNAQFTDTKYVIDTQSNSGVARLWISDGDGDYRSSVKLLGSGAVSVTSNGSDAVTIGLPVDTAMSDSSTNPVQNKTVKAYMDEVISNLPVEMFLDTAKTKFVDPFTFNAGLYDSPYGTDNPNLGGKPVLVLAMETGSGVTYSFLNMESLVEDYDSISNATIDELCV